MVNNQPVGEKPQRILIVKLGSIGDVVHTLPTLNALREKFPGMHIAWLVEPKAKDILTGHPALDEVIVFERTRSATKTIASFFKVIRKLRRNRYDAVLELQGSLKGALLAWLSGSPVRLGFKAGSSRVEWVSTIFSNVKVTEGSASHILERNLNFAKRLGAGNDEICFNINIGEQESKYIESFLKSNGIEGKRIIILHPGVTWSTKRWPSERYSELADRIKSDFEDVDVVLTYGPGEKLLVKEVCRLSKSSPIISCPTTLGQLIALLAKCQTMVSSDTGPLHIAAALGKRVIGLYGPIDSTRNGPYGDGNFVVKKDLACLPCWRKKCKSLSCMKGIAVSEVLEKVTAVLHKKLCS
ncbi:lipopolysaccharide heptosyltransferase II [candidate division NPL-UPA2 bacterium]|nr:lipopolysaccharide heptosyltransferase II [candidate division NPL-UPA2 bacterium]